MKKLLTIICALCLVMAFSMPAGAVDDIEDNQAVLGTVGSATAQAQDDALAIEDSGNFSGNLSGNTASDDDNVNVLSGNSDDDNVNLLSGNTDQSDDDFIDDDSNTNIDDIASNNDYLSNNKYEDESDDDFMDIDAGDDIASDNDNDLIDQDQTDNDLVDQDNTDNDLVDQDNTDNDLVDNDSHDNDNDVVDVDQNQTDNDLADNDMNDNVAAAAMGGFALGIKIDDIELNLASTTNVAGITQISGFGAGAANLGFWNDDAEVKYEGSCNSIDASVYDNTGIQAANFTAGNFNNSANMNNVTMTVQW